MINSVVDRKFEHSSSLRDEVRHRRGRLIDDLAAIVRSRSRQDVVAGRSYWHPNGFAKLVLEDDPQRGQVRLHVWPTVPADDDIHGHAWSYASTTLAGELTEVVYEETDRGEGSPMWRHSYTQVGHRRFAFVDPTEVRLAERGEPLVHRAGGASGGVPNHIHAFAASVAPAATLLRVGPITSRSSAVYRVTPEQPQIMAPRPTTRDDVREWIGYLADVVRD